ncbi:MAG: hypothetical protein KDC27_02105 [Acidobacteria bacterium]|nr:hypothetical protein [Acidobacteriota bacterium]
MRALVLSGFLACAVATAQVNFGTGGGGRTGASSHVGSGRTGAPSPITTATPTVTSTPDARLGAGSIRPRTGNILYPGTPSATNVGSNILTPGTPPGTLSVTQPIPSIVQPAPQPNPRVYDGNPRQGGGRGRSYRGAYPVYGFYPYAYVPNVIAVTGAAVTQSTVTQSGAGYVVTVGDHSDKQPAAESDNQAEQDAPDYWLIALQGGLIYAVSDYVIEGRAFRFVTLQGDEYVVPLAELDRAFTAKLNQDRGFVIQLD